MLQVEDGALCEIRYKNSSYIIPIKRGVNFPDLKNILDASNTLVLPVILNEKVESRWRAYAIISGLTAIWKGPSPFRFNCYHI